MSDVIELSIEETNKLRISLGLKPLKIDEPKKSTSTTTNTNTTNNNNTTTNDIKDTINQLKKKRESNLIGKSIAEQLLENGEDNDDDDGDDISNWVNKSRENEKKKLEEKKKSLRVGKKVEHYSQKNLKGLKVGNDLKNFEEDSETILTLQDTNVLDEDGEDVLVNVNISERERREKQIQDSKKKSKYDKFDEYGNSKYSLLNQDDQDNDGKNRNGFSLGDDGLIQVNDSAEQAKKNLDYLASYDMDTTTSASILSSFYTPAEMEKFKTRSAQKKSSSTGTDKKKKKIRKKNKDEDSEILANLDATTSSDLGSRKTRITEKEKREQENILKREENYQKALDKASEISKLTYSADIFEEAEDEDFYKTLSTSKKAPILSNKSIVDIVNKNKKQQQNENKEEENGTENLEEITINPTSEFVRSLNPEGIISNYKSNLTTASKIDIDEDEEMNDIKDNNNNDNRENNNDGDREDEEEEGDNEDKFKSITSLTEEPLVASSMAATLKLLAQKGDLQPQVPGNPKKRINYDDQESTIIEHKDEFGRVLDRKEAFVKISQIFHGKKSGKNKQEKRRKAYEEELKINKMDSSDTPLGMVKSFQSFQEKTNSPYLVLSSSNNNNTDSNNNLIFLSNLYKNNATTPTNNNNKKHSKK